MKKEERAKMEVAKAAAKKAAEETAAKKKVRGEVGEFGVGVNTVLHKFCEAISQKAMTMDEVRKAKWNEKGAKFNGRFAELKKNKVADRTKEGKMYIVGSPADPDGKPKAAPKKKAAAPKKKAAAPKKK